MIETWQDIKKEIDSDFEKINTGLNSYLTIKNFLVHTVMD